MDTARSATQQWVEILISGRVQGVGFRPFVYQLATSLSLSGDVENISGLVRIRLHTPSLLLEQFLNKLKSEAPIQANIEDVYTHTIEPFNSRDSFHIRESKIAQENNYDQEIQQTIAPEIAPDLRLCQNCLKELFNPDNPRYRHPFISCTQCGPRASIIKQLPFDRPNTSMAAFELCPSCEKEYTSPADRRFHAQTISCHHCGPQLTLFSDNGEELDSEPSPIEKTARALSEGQIVAIKSIGGIHLVCDARNSQAIQKLRNRKKRPDKPLAVMGLNTPSLQQWVSLSEQASQELNSPSAPICTCPKSSTSRFSKQIELLAPKIGSLGVMLPYTPLHYLLFEELLRLEGEVESTDIDWLHAPQSPALVITSANRSGEPLIADNLEALDKLAGIADLFLLHNRDITHRFDDSVVQPGPLPMVLRRARGIAPASLKTERSEACSLGVGALLKSTFCIATQGKAYLSPHIGDLNNPAVCHRLSQNVIQTMQILSPCLNTLTCDKHPDLFSSQLAEKLSDERAVPCIEVQHHHAHIAAVVAEHGVQGDVIGIALDGFGLGDDKQAWGGELFCGEVHQLQRIGHLSEIPLPGGDQATRDIWRLGAAIMYKLSPESWQQKYQPLLNAPLLSELIERSWAGALTSSAGRWFDAIASLLDIRQQVTYEGQAAMELESLARRFKKNRHSRHSARLDHGSGVLSLFPIVDTLLSLSDKSEAAYLFHVELADGLARWVQWAAEQQEIKSIVFGGGCFQNQLLRELLAYQLSSNDLDIYFPEQIPANDGGISLGQSIIGQRRLKNN